jgi:hypothetical protein
VAELREHLVGLVTSCKNPKEKSRSMYSKLIPIPNINYTSEVPAVKFLGLYIDPLLNFKFHIEKMSKKLATALFFMRCGKNFLTLNARKAMYYSLFHAVLIYGIHVWSSTAPSIIQPLVKKQKMAVRIIHDARYNDHTEPLFKSINILPIEKLTIYFDLQFMQHYVQNFLPTAFTDTWALSTHRRDPEFHMNLRNNEDYDVPFARLVSLERQPLTRLPKLWSEFENENIKIIRNKLLFNKELKIFLLNQLNDTIICDRLYCPQCHPPDRL